MRSKEICEIADGIAPFSISRELKEKYGAYDNSGLLVDFGSEIGGVLFSLDLSLAAVGEAKRLGADLIVTHHPAIWDGVKQISAENCPALFACLDARISVISAHLNLDAAPGGIDESLMRALGGEKPDAVMQEVPGGAYGRVYGVREQTLPAFAEAAGKTLGTSRVLTYGSKPVSRVASFCGGGFGEDSLRFALMHGADTLVSSDGKHHLLADAAEKGLNVVLLTHYAAEVYGFRIFFSRMREKLQAPCFFFADARLI